MGRIVDSRNVPVPSDKTPLYDFSRSATQTMDISPFSNPSSSMSRQPLFDVFLSFTPDTPRNLADNLYSLLTNAGIHVFRDDEGLEIGKEIHPRIIAVIVQSKISIPVISEDFASSKSSLMKLEQMLGCKDNDQHAIIPIFYHVSPLDVRNCSGSVERSIVKHKEGGISDSVVDSWKSALHRIGNLKGHHIRQTSEIYHGEVIKQIVHEVERMLKKRDLIVPKQLVGVEPHVQEIMAKLKVDYRDGQAVEIGDTCEKVLIHGIPGVGKTVLAKCVYNKINHLYDACGSLQEIQEEIRDHLIVSVQNRLISNLHKGNAPKFNCSDHALKHIRDRFGARKVLLLLDDVKDHEQLSALVEELDWLRPGSVVIVTSRRCDVLKKVKGAESFGLRTMQRDEALQLFSRHAFGKDSPHEDFKELSTDIVAAINGLPLALEEVGESLFGKSKKLWMKKLIQLIEAPDKSVQKAFLESYTTLDENEQNIFLDIACFFNGKDKRIPHYMWRDLEFSPTLAITSLCAMSLVEIGENKELRMPGILKTFGREIVKSENRDEPGKRSRLCDHEESLNLLKQRKGTEKVQAIALNFGDGSKQNISFECDQFDGLQNLTFLKLDRADLRGNFGDHFSRLRWLEWQGCPKIFDNQWLNLNVQHLVILDLSRSQVDSHWTGWVLLKQARKLKVLGLTGCVELIATPEFPASMELERLILDGCSNLALIHRSFRNLKKLISLNMKGCSLLSELPDLFLMRDLKELLIDGTPIRQINFKEGSMRQLKILSARDCQHLNEMGNSIRYLKSLKFLALDGSDICKLSESIESLEKLKTLSLKNCGRLSYLPDGIGKLRSLQSLDLSHTGIQELPPSVKDLKAMTVLGMRDTFMHEFPKAILNLEKLEEIDLSSCQKLEGKINCEIGTLSSLAILKLSDTRISSLPPSISRLSCLRELHILGCSNLESLPELPPSVNVFRDLVH